jgi:hypothetical protein
VILVEPTFTVDTVAVYPLSLNETISEAENTFWFL